MPKLVKEITKELTLDEQIKHDYDNGAYSPLQLAHKHRVEVDQVLVAIGQPEMTVVHIAGDQIDDAGPGASISQSSVQKVKYTKD